MNRHLGLTLKEVNENRRLHGSNEINLKKENQFIKIIKSIYKQPMFILLIICVILYLVLGNITDAVILSLMVIVIITIDIYQERKTDKTLEALKKLSSPIANVIREGKQVNVLSKDIVLNDIMVLSEGDKIVADAIILESYNLNVDESTLTGESTSVEKSVNLIDESEYYKSNYVYASTLVVSGNAIVKVVNIGENTENGRIAKNLSKIEKNNSPLQKSINNLVRTFGISSILCFLFLIVIITMKSNFKDGLLAGLAIAMSVIPEEFPVILTVFLTMGTYKIAKRNAIIRKLPAVETLGSITYLCVDKTGTITKNKMEVNRIVENGINKSTLLKNAILSSELLTYDPLEIAISEYAEKSNINKSALYKNKTLIKKFPFSSETKMIANILEEEKEKIIYVKGAVESLFDICDLSVEEKYQIHSKQKELSKMGLRVIGVCSKKISKVYNDIYKYNLHFDGLLALYDPPKEDIANNIKIAQNAGIKVVMLTGDNKDTASAIAKEIGLNNYESVITGKQLESLSNEELENSVKNVGVFARVIPEHKLRIVTLLQKLGEVVAMTGDGVNDAPSLKKADIGISMGKRGTEVAKEASDMILLDDDFSTIINTIASARGIYKNIKKSVSYVLTMHVPMVLLALLIPIFNLPIFLLPIHIVIMEMITDPTCSIIFERTKYSNKNLMSVSPRNKDEKLIDLKNLLRCLLRGISVSAFVLVSYFILIKNNGIAMSFSFGMLVISSIFLTYSILFEEETKIKDILKDKVILFINIGIILFTLAFIYVPFLNSIVKTKPLSIHMLLLIIILSFISVFWINLFKRKDLVNDNK